MSSNTRTLLIVVGALAAGVGCRQGAVRTPLETAPSGAQSSTAPQLQIANFTQVADGLFSGAQPESDAEFDALAAYGVRTVISVDGAVPDAAAARARGMRYVHLPIGYDGVEPEQRVELTRALRDLPKPIYMHCHHGKHRGPAAAAVAAIGAGKIDCTTGHALLERVGTSPQYPGLWFAVDHMQALDDAVIDTAPSAFPERAEIGDFTAAMAQLDRASDHLKLVRDAGWRAPANHPDLVPLAEAARLADILRSLGDDPYIQDKPDDFRNKLQDAVTHSILLESAVAKDDADASTQALDALNTSCKHCHRRYRD